MYVLMFSFAHAAVYKHVEANGRVTYTDKPPANAIKPNKAEEKHILSEPLPQSGVQFTLPPDAESDPVKASAGVAGLYFSVEQVADFCRMNVPTTAEKAVEARKKWKATHEALSKKSACILREKMSGDEYRQFLAMLDAEGRKNSALLAKASQSEKQKICEGLPARFALPQVNLMLRTRLVDVINKTPSKLCPS